MKKTLIRGGLLLTLLLLLAACATAPKPMEPFSAQDLNGKVSSGEYMAKPEHFVVVFDASSSMGEAYKGQLNTGHSKFAVAKDLVDRMNQTMPALPIQGGMVVFGGGKAPVTPVYGMTDYTQEGFAEGLGKIAAPGGTTPMGLGLAEAKASLMEAQGDIAIIVFSDGVENSPSTPALEAVNMIKGQFGDRVCIYTVFVGNEDKGRKLMSDLADATACGSAKSADELATADAMAAFVEEVFLEEAPMKPAPAPAPLPVPQPKISWILGGVTFEFDSAVLRPESKEVLQSDIQILKENPQIRVEVQGHTDDIGSDEYNMGLSDRRANSVKEYLISQGIAADRLTSRGYGETRPRFPNDSEANRAKNRRVELVPMN